MTARKRLFIALGFLAVVYVTGVVGYLIIDPDLTILDATYHVAITLSTVGYREVVHTTTASKVWTVLIIVFGVSAATVAISSATGLIVGGEVGRLIGSKKMEARIKHLDKHVIICGFGRMGQQLAKTLAERQVPVVVIERDERLAQTIEALDQLDIIGDATEESSLERAGIERARGLVAALGSDADNVFVTLSAREMRPDLHIVARAEQFSAEPKLRRAGANRVISPQAIGAERIANILTQPHVVDFVEMAAKGVELEMESIPIAGDSPLAGKSLRESDIRSKAEVMVVAIKRPDGTTQFNPGAHERVQPNDTLITIGPAGAAHRLAKMRLITDASPNEA